MISIVLAALVAAQTATPDNPDSAALETPIGTRLPRERQFPVIPDADSDKANEVLQEFSTCMVKKDPDLVASIVDPPLSNDLSFRPKLYARATRHMSRCLGSIVGGGQMSADQFVMTGALAGQLYVERFAKLPALASTRMPLLDPEDQATLITTLTFANCLIDRAPMWVDYLVRSNVGSDQELNAYKAIAPHYEVCLDTGTVLKLNRLSLRTALSDQLYRRALAGSESTQTAASGKQ